MQYKKVNSIEDLRTSCLKKWSNYIIVLKCGISSRKDICFNGKEFRIVHHIDDSKSKMTPDELEADTILGKAITKGAFYQELDDTVICDTE